MDTLFIKIVFKKYMNNDIQINNFEVNNIKIEFEINNNFDK